MNGETPDPVNTPYITDADNIAADAIDEIAEQASGDFEGLHTETIVDAADVEQFQARYVQCPNCGYNVGVALE